jgi:limonene 1,2-monooxygenase
LGGVSAPVVDAHESLAHDWAPPAAKWRSYELFARHVAPRFQGQATPTLDAKARARARRTELAESNLKAVEMSTAKYEAERDAAARERG